MKRRLMVLGLAIVMTFTSFSVCAIDEAYGSTKIDKKDRKYTEKEIDSTVKERANQLIKTFDGKFFTTDGCRAYGSDSSKCNVLSVLNKSKRVRNLNEKYKGGKRPPSKSYLPYIYSHNVQMMPPAYSCVGFAMYAQWYLFANRYNDDVEVYRVIDEYKYNYKNMKRYARPGDVIWTSGDFSYGHASVVLEVTRKGVKVLDSNTAVYSYADFSDNRVCVYVLEYSDQYRVTLSRPKNYYIHYSDGLKKTSYEKEARLIHEQVVGQGDSIRLHKEKFKREGYTYRKYNICRVKDGKYQYLCKNKKTGKRVWLTSKKITSKYKKIAVKVGGKLKLASGTVKKGREITLTPVWEKKKEKK